jgi:hypothetical protein
MKDINTNPELISKDTSYQNALMIVQTIKHGTLEEL